MVVAKSKFSWRVAVEALAGRRAKSLESFDDLVNRAARGEQFAEADIERTLNLSGRSPEEFAEAVERKSERLRLAGEVERLERLAEAGHEAEAEELRIVAEHNERVAAMARELEPRLSELRRIQNEAASARTRASDFRARLSATADSELLDQEQTIAAELREAVAAEHHAWSVLDDHRSRLGGLDRNAEGVANLRQRAEQERSRVRELQNRMAEIAVAKESP